jgi:segregation and condensation protein B
MTMPQNLDIAASTGQSGEARRQLHPTVVRQCELDLSAHDGPPPGPERVALIEALLLAAVEPPTVEELAQGAGLATAEIEASLTELELREDRGWVIQRHGQTVQLATAPRFAAYVRRFLKLEREARLSSAALETLAIVAYQQPVTRSEIEGIRGVDSAGVLATLHSRNLIDAVGRLPSPGHPIQYGTTPDFLRHFGLRSVAELPPLGQVDGRDARTALEAAAVAAEIDPHHDGDATPSTGETDQSATIS